MIDTNTTNLIIAALAGGGSLAGYLKFTGGQVFQRPSLMSKETKKEFDNICGKKQSVDMCDSKMELVDNKFGAITEDISEIKIDIKTILRGLNGKK